MIGIQLGNFATHLEILPISLEAIVELETTLKRLITRFSLRQARRYTILCFKAHDGFLSLWYLLGEGIMET